MLPCRCVGGFLQVIDGVRALRGNSSAVHVFCANDIRFEHPVTIFKDRKCHHLDSCVLYIRGTDRSQLTHFER